MKVVLFSDLHLDAAFGWLGAANDVARGWRRDLRETLLGILRLAYEERADAVFCGGDLYEQDRFAPDTAAFLRKAFADASPLRIYIAPGNHDYYGPQSLYRTTEWSPNVHVFSDPELVPVELEPGLTLWGAAHRAPASTRNFLSGFTVGDGAGIDIALFHGSELGWLAAQEEDKQPHAPFTADDLEASGLSHAFLGHLHAPRHAPLHTYPGNPNPLAFGERGERGAVIAEIGGDGEVHRETRDVAVTDVSDVAVDVTGCDTQQEIEARVRDALEGLTGCVRVTLSGELAADVDLHPADLGQLAPAPAAVTVRIGELHVAYDLDQIAEQPTVRGQFVRDVVAADLAEEEARRILVTGLRALDSRRDLEVA